MDTINWQDFQKIQLLTGTVVQVEEFPRARNPSWILYIDMGTLGIKKSSAQITVHYTKEDLVGKQVVCVANFPPKQIGKIMSEVLVTGFPDENGDVVLCTPDKRLPNGAKLF
ncbi:MAG: tRNA-binding protein [Roseivirga sp.]|nr:tRNA-binding protein [Roseivirga sp.]